MFRVAIILFPGTNCEGETRRMLLNAGLQADYVRWNQRDLVPQYDAYVLPGGFAYEDRGRAGIVAAQDPIMQLIKTEAQHGKPVIGICNGCQVLVETGLIPGVNDTALAGAVAMNTRVKDGKIIGTGFYHDRVYIETVTPKDRCAVTMGLDHGTVFPATVANGEGRFIFPTDVLLELEQHDQIIFKYCTSTGVILNEFPTTPNGAMWGIAGLCNPAGNVVAYMPHPERHDTGVELFVALRRYLEQPPVRTPYQLQWQSPTSVIEPYQPNDNCMQLFVELVIADNTATTIELALRQRGLTVQVHRKIHWEVWLNSNTKPDTATLTTLVQTGELLNTNKEKFSNHYQVPPQTYSFLVRYNDDYEGKAVADTLRQRFNLNYVDNVRKGVLWELHCPAGDAQSQLAEVQKILQTYMLYNPYAQECKIMSTV
ncbi:MAG: phosphoribosylformylglycinamidine synthase I [Candidatus Kerfeldbacteria bacterium]|nr:phosphoribosylformylglycinamidine synthase I [Candidatus Kerfeldbacteria bacterium]